MFAEIIDGNSVVLQLPDSICTEAHYMLVLVIYSYTFTFVYIQVSFIKLRYTLYFIEKTGMGVANY